MGAGASLTTVYGEALEWFKCYFDTETYISDFKSIDRNSDGGITDEELMRWINLKKQTQGGSWSVMVAHKDVFHMAHAQTISNSNGEGTGKAFTLPMFRAFLLHVYAISMLWQHFKRADDDEETGDVGNLRLTRDEFTMAVNTLCSSRAGETVTPEQLEKDFEMLDTNHDNRIVFSEACSHCCRYLERTHAETFGNPLHSLSTDIPLKHYPTEEANSSLKSPVQATNAAVDAMLESTHQESTKITYAALKISTENALQVAFQEQAQISNLNEEANMMSSSSGQSSKSRKSTKSGKNGRSSKHESVTLMSNKALRRSYDDHARASTKNPELSIEVIRVGSLDHHHGEDHFALDLSPPCSPFTSPRLPCQIESDLNESDEGDADADCGFGAFGVEGEGDDEDEKGGKGGDVTAAAAAAEQQIPRKSPRPPETAGSDTQPAVARSDALPPAQASPRLVVGQLILIENSVSGEGADVVL